MARTIRRWSVRVIAAATVIVGGAALDAQNPLTIQISGRYYAEPATVDVLIAVEPSESNRTLRVEADGQNFYRASDLVLQGAEEHRYHTIMFRNVPAGDYVVRAVLRSGKRELAVAQTQLVVMDK